MNWLRFVYIVACILSGVSGVMTLVGIINVLKHRDSNHVDIGMVILFALSVAWVIAGVK